MRIIQVKSFRGFLIGLLILGLVVLPVKAGILVIANMDESNIVLVDDRTYKPLATLPTGGKQLTTFRTGRKPDGIGWAK